MSIRESYVELLAATHSNLELAEIIADMKESAAAPRVFDWSVVENPSPVLYEQTRGDYYHPADREYEQRDAVLAEPLSDYLKSLGFIIENR